MAKLEKQQTDEFKKVMSLCQEYDIPMSNTMDLTKIEKIKADPSLLKEYILNLINMENNIYSVMKHLEKLYLDLKNWQRYTGPSCSSYIQNVKGAESILKSRYSVLKECESKWESREKPKEPVAPTLKEPNFFNKKSVMKQNEAMQKNYQLELSNYKKMLQDYENEKQRALALPKEDVEKAERALAQAKSTLEKIKEETEKKTLATKQIVIEMVEKEITDATVMLKSIYECRNKLYALDIIFGKYRNTVALSTFYEYLMAGRCTQLEGINGAYNIYENELRANLIIEKLDEIKENQYTTYTALQAINHNLDYLENTMSTALNSIGKDLKNISDNTDIIAHNTAVTAYYSKMNAELTNSLGYLIALS